MTNSTTKKALLVGAGNMGKNHLRVLLEHPGVALTAVVDPKLSKNALPPHVQHYSSPEEVDLASIDFAVLATPTESHYEIAKKLLNQNVPLLIEKPLASTNAQCEELIDLATKKNIAVAVGHVERHNPAVIKLREVIKNGWIGTPIHFNFTRVGGFPNQVKAGNDVLLDLAVHDIDVLTSMIGPCEVAASVCHSTWKQGVWDTAEILMKSSGSASASLHVNWVTPTKIRTIRVTGTRGVCFVDYILQTCTLMGGNLLNKAPDNSNAFSDLIEQYRNGDKIEFGIKKEEPLKRQLTEFLNALSNQPNTSCTMFEAALAVKLATRAVQMGNS